MTRTSRSVWLAEGATSRPAELTGEQIRDNLTRFVAKWSLRAGYEKGEATLFLIDLFACYGTDVDEVAKFEHFKRGGFMDLFWPGKCIIEMKSRSEAKRLEIHRRQLFDYRAESADYDASLPAAEYAVLCAFERFEVWEPGRYPKDPRDAFSLEELPDHYTSLLFLADRKPVYEKDRTVVTLEAVEHLARLTASLEERGEGEPDERRRFILQCVWCMFAEDLGQISDLRFRTLIEGLQADHSRSSADDLTRMFEWLNDPAPAPARPKHGLYAGVPYANGSLFANPARIHLDPDELEMLRRAVEFQWREIQPAIFGSLLKGVVGAEKAHALGAHYTPEYEIQRIVGPTIVEPWRRLIDGIKTHSEAQQLQNELLNFTVLDPACGSGNFLYVAYRELRTIEDRLARRAADLAREEGRADAGQEGLRAFFPLQNMRGLEIEQFAVDLTRVTLWMGHKLIVDELGLDESTLPLADLSGVRRDDALRTPWPAANAIIGNPPYHGSQNLRSVLDDDYVEWLRDTFDCGLKDLCVYWFRRAADQMRPGDRAGLVGTNSISQNRARGASLNYVVEKGGVITNAISRHKWPAEAVVNVSIVNWIQQPAEQPDRFTLDGEPVSGISTRLGESVLPIEEYDKLSANAGRSFQGPIPVGPFQLDPKEAQNLLALRDANYEDVVRPYLIGDDITEDPGQQPRRFVIDFGLRSLEDAMLYPEALKLVRERVKPMRDKNTVKRRRERWWLFGSPATEMRRAIGKLERFIAGNAQGKRFLFTWQGAEVSPSNLTNVFAFSDDYAMGILTSSTHLSWAHGESSTLEDRPRYTPTSCFETFPWPEATAAQREEIGALSATLIMRRQEICAERHIGLTDLYNLVDEGAYKDLNDCHVNLDQAVARAYGWPQATAADPLEIRTRLVARHAEIAAEASYQPFAYLDDAT